MSKTDKELTAEVVESLFQVQNLKGINNDAIVRIIKDVHSAFKSLED